MPSVYLTAIVRIVLKVVVTPTRNLSDSDIIETKVRSCLQFVDSEYDSKVIMTLKAKKCLGW
jgi:hypothetical protein